MENRTACEQTDEIDLVSLFFTVMHKYRQIIAGAVICAVLFGVLGAFKNVLNQRAIATAEANGETVPRTSAEQQYEEDMVEYRQAQTTHDQDVANYKQQLSQNEADQTRAEYDIENAQEYIDKSVLNKLDPYNVYMSEASFYITTDYKILPGMDYQSPDYTSAVLSAYSSLLTSHETIGDIADQFNMEERYMRELIEISVDNSTRLLTISAKGEDAAQASGIMNALLKSFEGLHDTIVESVGNHNATQVSLSNSTTVLTWLRDSQQSTRDNMTQLQNNLTNLKTQHDLLEQSIETADQDLAALEKPEEPKKSSGIVKFAVIGFLLGCVAVAGVAVCQFLMNDRVNSEADLQRNCGIPVLGTLASESSKKAKGFDAYLNKLEKRPDGSKDGELLDLIAATIQGRAPQAEKIVVTGDIPAQQLSALKDALQAANAMKGKTIVAAECILTSSATIPQVADADVVVLAVDHDHSQYGAVRSQNEKIHALGKEVFGCILYA